MKTLDSEPGESIGDFAKRLIEYRKQHRCDVKGSHNGWEVRHHLHIKHDLYIQWDLQRKLAVIKAKYGIDSDNL